MERARKGQASYIWSNPKDTLSNFRTQTQLYFYYVFSLTDIYIFFFLWKTGKSGKSFDSQFEILPICGKSTFPYDCLDYWFTFSFHFLRRLLHSGVCYEIAYVCIFHPVISMASDWLIWLNRYNSFFIYLFFLKFGNRTICSLTLSDAWKLT